MERGGRGEERRGGGEWATVVVCRDFGVGVGVGVRWEDVVVLVEAYIYMFKTWYVSFNMVTPCRRHAIHHESGNLLVIIGIVSRVAGLWCGWVMGFIGGGGHMRVSDPSFTLKFSEQVTRARGVDKNPE